MDITSQDQWVLHRLETYYTTHPDALAHLRDILNGTSTISLRVLDWFVTNYSKKNNVSYMTTTGRHVIVYLAYKARLKAYSKRMLDPFCRWDRIQFQGVSTTVGQLNFFAWVHEDEIFQYLQAHLDEVQADMDARMQSKKQATDGTRRRRHELSNSATKSMKRHDVRIVVQFD
jgi:hypothetical protein